MADSVIPQRKLLTALESRDVGRAGTPETPSILSAQNPEPEAS